MCICLIKLACVLVDKECITTPKYVAVCSLCSFVKPICKAVEIHVIVVT